MNILMVSGFLGAGKTTFIKTMAEVTGRDFVVLENEYAQTDIDAQLLGEQADIEVYELAQGCVCCTMKQDFAASILTIANTLDPEVLIVEPTGVARLSSLMENVGRITYERIALLKPLAVVDGLVFDRQMARGDEIYLDQLRHASVIVVSKVEHADAQTVAGIEARLRELNPEAELVFGAYAERSASWFAGLLERYADGRERLGAHGAAADSALAVAAGVRQGGAFGASNGSVRVQEEPESITLHGVSLDSPAKLVALLDAVSFGVFGTVLRAKGYLPCNGAWLRFDVVDGIWGITGFEGSEPEQSEAVFIGWDLKRSWLRELLLPVYRKSLIGASRVLSRTQAPRRPFSG